MWWEGAKTLIPEIQEGTSEKVETNFNHSSTFNYGLIRIADATWAQQWFWYYTEEKKLLLGPGFEKLDPINVGPTKKLCLLCH